MSTQSEAEQKEKSPQAERRAEAYRVTEVGKEMVSPF